MNTSAVWQRVGVGAAPATAALLERDGELDRLAAALAAAGSGRGRVVFVGGEAGIGKTALVSTFAASVDDGTRVAIGRADALVTPRALGPILDVAATLGADGSLDRDALLGSISAVLRDGTTTLIVIEDAHWADAATIELLAMLGRRAPDLPLLLVVTYREDEVTGEHPLRQIIGDLVTASSTTWLGLTPLSIDAVRQLAAPRGADSEVLYARTGGNPFFVTEALAAPGEVVPTTVRLAVLARASRLDPASRAVLDAVAIIPGGAEAWLVRELCNPSTLEASIDACLDSGALVAAAGMYAFRHELARLAVESQIADGARRQLHRRALDALDRRPGADPARLVHHAGEAGDERALARASMAACLLAASCTAHREAVLHGERALALRRELTADDVAELQLRLAPSLVATARGDEAVRLVEEAAEHWRSRGEDRREAEALVLLSSALASLGRTEAAAAPLERAVSLLQRRPPGPELALAYLRLTSAHMLARDRDTAVVWGERAIALATELDDRPLLGRALIETGIADVMDARFDGLRRVREGIEVGRRHGLPGVVALGLSQIGSGCGEMRRYDEAVPALIEGSEYAAAHHLEHVRLYMVAWSGRCRLDLGEWEDAEVLCREAIGGPRAVAIARFVGLNTLGWLRARRGDGDAWPLLDEALEIATEMAHLQRLWPCAAARAEAAWLEDGLDEQVPLLEEVLGLALRCRHGIAAGQIGLWLARADRITDPPPGSAEYFARWIAGDHLGAATLLRDMGCSYEAAAALADSGETTSMRKALAIFDQLGAAPMAERVGSELRRRGVRLPKRRAADAEPSRLSEREREVLRLVAAGFNNPQIASALYISRKTAEHHVSAILGKLGVASRAEAAAAAVRLGLG